MMVKSKLWMLILLLVGCFCVKADTTDQYRVYYRGRLVAATVQSQHISVVLKVADIGPTYSIRVDVFRDAGCSTCTYGLLIFGSRTPVYIDTTQPTDDFIFPLAPLVEDQRKNGGGTYIGYYTEYFEDPTKSRVVSFTIKLE